MTKTTIPAIQNVVNTAAIRLAEQQFRIARLFSPYDFEPERVDFDRCAAFLDDVQRAFPSPTPNLQAAIDRIKDSTQEQLDILAAFESQDVAPTLTPDQLFQTAQANVKSPGMARYNEAA